MSIFIILYFIILHNQCLQFSCKGVAELLLLWTKLHSAASVLQGLINATKMLTVKYFGVT